MVQNYNYAKKPDRQRGHRRFEPFLISGDFLFRLQGKRKYPERDVTGMSSKVYNIVTCRDKRVSLHVDLGINNPSEGPASRPPRRNLYDVAHARISKIPHSKGTGI